MKWEKSCGGVVFTRENNTIRYLIIRHLGGHCGFPKGHIEPGESEPETAIREIREETGLAVSLVEGFRAADSYPLPNTPGAWKEIVYFLAEFSDQTIHTQPEEISEAYLVSYEEALRLLPFPDSKRILTEAHHFLTSK